MAFIYLKNNTGRIISPEQGAAIWQIMTGEKQGTKAQRDFVRKIRKVYLNPASAPSSYRSQLPRSPKPEPFQPTLPYKDSD